MPAEKKGMEDTLTVVTENFPKLIPGTKQMREAQEYTKQGKCLPDPPTKETNRRYT